jgi:hypothetical protein
MIRARLLRVLLLAVALACVVCSTAAAAQLATLRVQTVPALKGIPIAVDGRVLRTDERGAAELLAEVPVVGNTASLRRTLGSVTVLGANIGPGVHAELGRWYAIGGWRRPLADRYVLHAALDVSYTVTPRFVEPSGREIDRARVSSVVVKSSDGTLHTFKGSEDLRLHGTRVARIGSQLRANDIQYSLQRVTVDGANVVNRGELRFRPRRTRELTMRLRFYPARFMVRDAFFGFSTGSAIRLRFPDGRVERHELNPDGEVNLPSLPRGDYEVEVEGPGVLSKTPVSLSRGQQVELKVVSYLDLAIAALAILAVSVILPLAGRPGRLRVRVPRLASRRPHDLRRRRAPTQTPVVRWVSLDDGPPVKLVDFFEEGDEAAFSDWEPAADSPAPAPEGAQRR